MTLDRDMEIGMTEPEAGIEVEKETGKCKIDPELSQMTEEDQGLGLTLE